MHKLNGGEDPAKGVELLLYDLPFYIRRQQTLENSEHDPSNAKKMEAFREFAEIVLKRRGHGIISCSRVQFAS